MVSGLTAQRVQTQHDFNKMYTPATEQEASQARRQGMDLIELRQDRGGAIFFSEDFKRIRRKQWFRWMDHRRYRRQLYLDGC